MAATSYNNAFCVAMDTTDGVSAPASFWKTTDGGANWSLVTGVMNASNTFADGVVFWNSNKGFCYGDPVSSKFDIYYTTDGGTTWSPTLAADLPTPLSGEYGYNGADCAAKGVNGMAAFITNKGRVIVTSDYGIHWAATATAPFTACPGAKIYLTSNSIVVANFVEASSTWDWKYSTDGGATWNAYTAASGTFYQYAMCYVPGTVNMLVATSPYSTGDKGVGYANDALNWADFYDATFLQDYSAANMQMLGVAFADSSNGWVGNYNYFGGENSILRYQRNNSTRFSVVASALQVSSVDAGTVSGVGNYNSGASVTLIATPLAGYVFEKWVSYPDQTDVSTNATYTFTMPASNVALLASFIVDPSAGVAQNDFGKLTVSPNPAANNVTIALNSKQTGVFNVNIVDLTGKSVYTNSLEANATMNVDVTAFAKGVYFVKINNDKTQFVQKLIVK